MTGQSFPQNFKIAYNGILIPFKKTAFWGHIFVNLVSNFGQVSIPTHKTLRLIPTTINTNSNANVSQDLQQQNKLSDKEKGQRISLQYDDDWHVTNNDRLFMTLRIPQRRMNELQFRLRSGLQCSTEQTESASTSVS